MVFLNGNFFIILKIIVWQNVLIYLLKVIVLNKCFFGILIFISKYYILKMGYVYKYKIVYKKNFDGVVIGMFFFFFVKQDLVDILIVMRFKSCVLLE